MSLVDANNDGQGDNPVNLTDTTRQDLDPVYAPNGARIAFRRNLSTNAEIRTGSGMELSSKCAREPATKG